MPTSHRVKSVAGTLRFDKFWEWLKAHANCIVQAGTPEVLLFDDDDLHWHLSVEEDETYLVQLMRGKHTLAELAMIPQDVAYVQIEPGSGDETLFNLISETETGQIAVYHFLLSHGFDAELGDTSDRFAH